MSGRHALPCGKKCTWKGSVKRHLPLTKGAGPVLTSDSSTWCCRDAAQRETCRLACLGQCPGWDLTPHIRTTLLHTGFSEQRDPRVTNASVYWDRRQEPPFLPACLSLRSAWSDQLGFYPVSQEVSVLGGRPGLEQTSVKSGLKTGRLLPSEDAFGASLHLW